MWMVLDLDQDEWRRYSKFTLRLSWPASSPANFFVHVHSPESLLAWLSQGQHNSTARLVPVEHVITGHRKRRKYAHISVLDGTSGPPVSAQPAYSSPPKRVAFRIILEPLIMGVLPASMQHTALVLVLVASAAALAVPWINGYLEQVAQKAISETRQAEGSSTKEE